MHLSETIYILATQTMLVFVFLLDLLTIIKKYIFRIWLSLYFKFKAQGVNRKRTLTRIKFVLQTHYQH